MKFSKTRGKIKKNRDFNVHSIKFKLVAYFTLLLLVFSATIGVITVKNTTEALTREAENGLRSLSMEGARVVRAKLDERMSILETMATGPNIQSMDWEQQLSVLSVQRDARGFLDLAVVDLNGIARYTDGTEADLSQRDYIQRALSGESNVSDVLISVISGDPVVMIATPIINNGQVVGALIGRNSGDLLSEMVEDSRIGNSGYAYIINLDGTVVAHRDSELVRNRFNPILEKNENSQLESLASFFEEIQDTIHGVARYNFNGNDLYGGYSYIQGTEWVFVYTANVGEIIESVGESTKIISSTMLIGVLIVIGFIYYLSSKIANPIMHAVGVANNIADLDLTVEVPEEYRKRKDEVGSLALSFDRLINSLKDIIKEVGNSSEDLGMASEELMFKSSETAQTGEEVSKTVEEIAKGASEQAISTEEGSKKALLLGEAVEKNKDYLSSLNQSSNQVSEIVGEGLREIEKLLNINEESNQASGQVGRVVIETDNSSKKIAQASDLISKIAEQTNLLALNAAIEAARAGEAGRGFAVVADEIRRLAEQSSESTKMIQEVVMGLQANSSEAVESIDRLREIEEIQNQSILKNKSNFNEISKAMKYTFEAIASINGSGEEVDEIKNEILDVLQNLTAIAEENSASTQEASASMEEQSSSMDEIAQSADALAGLAQNLQMVVDKFKI